MRSARSIVAGAENRPPCHSVSSKNSLLYGASSQDVNLCIKTVIHTAVIPVLCRYTPHLCIPFGSALHSSSLLNDVLLRGIARNHGRRRLFHLQLPVVEGDFKKKSAGYNEAKHRQHAGCH